MRISYHASNSATDARCLIPFAVPGDARVIGYSAAGPLRIQTARDRCFRGDGAALKKLGERPKCSRVAASRYKSEAADRLSGPLTAPSSGRPALAACAVTDE